MSGLKKFTGAASFVGGECQPEILVKIEYAGNGGAQHIVTGRIPDNFTLLIRKIDPRPEDEMEKKKLSQDYCTCRSTYLHPDPNCPIHDGAIAFTCKPKEERRKMKSIQEIDEIMQTIPDKWRKRWCGAESGPCACLGCVQIGNRMVMYEKLTGQKFTGDPEYLNEDKFPEEIYNRYKITKEEWELWSKS